MRYLFATAFVLALAACGAPPAAVGGAAPEDSSAGSTGVGSVPDAAFTLESEALVGLWSFDRTCGLYDVVLAADGTATYYDYSSDDVVTHIGTWATADGNRLVLTTRQAGPDGAPAGNAENYSIAVDAPITDDLVGRLTRGDGSGPRDISALRCPEEDRD